MKLKLVRTQCGKNATLGQLSIDGDDFCFTCEDPDRKLETVGESGKIHGNTCIPRGTYKVLITPSTRFGRDLPLLIDVPFFQGIRIHPGNTPADTEGCLLVGSGVNGDSVINSRVTFSNLFEKIKIAIDSGQSVEIEVV